jgi:Concanavalin A-like lectin/glucanases superfamily
MRRHGTAVVSVLLLGAAVVTIALEEWRGAVVLTLSQGHGIHTADLLAAPLVVLAVWIWRRRLAKPDQRSHGRLGAVSAVALGVLLLLAGVGTTAGGGPLVPAGGGTFDGSIWQASGSSALAVGHWSYVAVTYDGTTLRMFVNGGQVASRHVTGAIQATREPLWIGGNHPYGEYFHGEIDEVRVYARALSTDEIRADMFNPVTASDGLAAAYSFDAGSGDRVADVSGNGNDGMIEGATWTQGRRGHALRFQSAGALVRVPPSAALNLTHTMTLSAWVCPSAEQSGWRTIVQRQQDAYLLSAGSDHLDSLGRLDDLRAALVVLAFAWFCVLLATGRMGSVDDRRRSWWQPVGLFVLGSLVDALFAPSDSVIGPTLVALWLAGTAASRAEAVAFVACACAGVAWTIASLAELGGEMTRDNGGVARAIALGALFVLAAAAQILPARAKGRAGTGRLLTDE